jgi:sulfoxide reductase heme-binding subunit YedZ
VSLHFLTYLVLDQFFAWKYIIEDIVDRPYILVGFTAFVCLIPLAITSTNGMVKRLGGKRWQQLHKLVYAIAILGSLHYYLGVKADITWPAIYGLVLSVLLGYRWLRFKFSIRSKSLPVAKFRAPAMKGKSATECPRSCLKS